MKSWICIAVMLGLAGTASASPLILDYTGFTWSSFSSGQPVTFSAVGVVDGFSEPVNLDSEVYTFSLDGLMLSSVTTLSPSTKRYTYSGGMLGIYHSTDDSNRPYVYGTNPNALTTPSTFVDGVQWLGGELTSFTVTINSVLNLGNLSAAGQFTTGEFANRLAGDNWFSFAGLTGRSGNGIPDGYRYRLDGEASSEVSTPVPEPTSLLLLAGGLLGLVVYRRRQSR
jgi:hypothetical protein